MIARALGRTIAKWLSQGQSDRVNFAIALVR